MKKIMKVMAVALFLAMAVGAGIMLYAQEGGGPSDPRCPTGPPFGCLNMGSVCEVWHNPYTGKDQPEYCTPFYTYCPAGGCYSGYICMCR